jgi:hypothetical protein
MLGPLLTTLALILIPVGIYTAIKWPRRPKTRDELIREGLRILARGTTRK